MNHTLVDFGTSHPPTRSRNESQRGRVGLHSRAGVKRRGYWTLVKNRRPEKKTGDVLVKLLYLFFSLFSFSRLSCTPGTVSCRRLYFLRLRVVSTALCLCVAGGDGRGSDTERFGVVEGSREEKTPNPYAHSPGAGTVGLFQVDEGEDDRGPVERRPGVSGVRGGAHHLLSVCVRRPFFSLARVRTPTPTSPLLPPGSGPSPVPRTLNLGVLEGGGSL